MADITPYESNHPCRLEQSANISLGRIVDVDITKRTCTVATLTGRGSIFDQYITDVPWLCQDANPEGDESGSIPRKGSWGVCYFLDGQTFMGNYTRPIGDQGTTLRGNEAATLNEGDKIISTLAGNRITIKRSGLIELFVTDNLKRLFLPTKGQIIDICRTYNMKADGGLHEWSYDKALNTLSRKEYYTSTARYFTMEEKKGYVTGSLISKTSIGSGIPGVEGPTLPTYVQTIGITGEVNTEIHPPLPEGSPSGYKSTIGPDGSVEILAGAAQTVVANIGATGAVGLSVNELVDVSISEAGDIDITGPIASLSMAAAGGIVVKNAVVTVTISAAGEVQISAPNAVTIEGKAGVNIKSLGPVNIEGVGPMNIKTKGQVMIDGGTGASDFVLTNPTTLSPFTGAPLVPFSTTVMVSK